LNGRRHFRGTIEAVTEEKVEVKDADQQIYSLPFAGISKAKLDPDIKF